MSTTMPKAADISRKWYVLDAAGKPLGRVADVYKRQQKLLVGQGNAVSLDAFDDGFDVLADEEPVLGVGNPRDRDHVNGDEGDDAAADVHESAKLL